MNSLFLYVSPSFANSRAGSASQDIAEKNLSGWPKMELIVGDDYGLTKDKLGENEIIIADVERCYAMRLDNHLQQRDDRDLFLAKAMLDSLKHKNPPYDILVCGRSLPCQYLVRLINREIAPAIRPIIVSFSVEYGEAALVDGLLGQGQLRYDLDCPKDFGLIQKLLSDEYFLEAVNLRNSEQLKDAILEFNERFGQERPVLVL